MESRDSSRPPRAANGQSTYPVIKLEGLAPPPPGRAIGFRGCQMALWKRLVRSFRRLGIGVAALVALVVAVVLLPPSNAAVSFLVFVLGLVGTICIIAGSGGLVRTLRFYRLLRAYEWTVYNCERLSIRESGPITLILVKGDSRFPVKVTKTKRAELLRGMLRPEVWYVGDPARAGILTVAGGGEMFRTEPIDMLMLRPTPEQERRLATQEVLKRRRWEQRGKERAARERARLPKPLESAKPLEPPKDLKPAKALKPAKPQPVRQPKLPRVRGGQKIKWH